MHRNCRKTFKIKQRKIEKNRRRLHFLSNGWPTQLSILYTYTERFSPKRKSQKLHPNEKPFKALKTFKAKYNRERKKIDKNVSREKNENKDVEL